LTKIQVTFPIAKILDPLLVRAERVALVQTMLFLESLCETDAVKLTSWHRFTSSSSSVSVTTRDRVVGSNSNLSVVNNRRQHDAAAVCNADVQPSDAHTDRQLTVAEHRQTSPELGRRGGSEPRRQCGASTKDDDDSVTTPSSEFTTASDVAGDASSHHHDNSDVDDVLCCRSEPLFNYATHI